MTTHGACMPGGPGPGQDRWTVTPTGIIVLDGASALAPDTPAADRYVDALLDALAHRLDRHTPLSAILADAIATVAADLHLTPGTAPSSTVALLRWTDTQVDAAVLGDSTIVIGLTDGTVVRLTDDRLSAVAAGRRQEYRARLEHGHGFDAIHHQLLRAVQADERRVRNTAPGYWIAEADPSAASHATTGQYERTALRWAVLATDGAQAPIDHRGVPWATIPELDDRALHALLHDLHHWEAERDPDGQHLPRAKRHDDKALVTWTPDPS